MYFAIGDKSIAPIIYLKENNCAVIANEYEEIENQLRKLIENPKMIQQYSRNSFECGKKNHNETIIKKVFVETFLKATDFCVKE